MPTIKTVVEVAMFSDAWRSARVLDGDMALSYATQAVEKEHYSRAAMWTAIAQAHYSAANVRSSGRYGQTLRERSPEQPADRSSVVTEHGPRRMREGTTVIGGH